MTKRYRKRFVLITMALLGIVLLIGFSFLYIYVRTNNAHSLENTMQQVVEPWDDPIEEMPPEKPDGDPAQDGDMPPDLPENGPSGPAPNADGDPRRQKQRRIGDYSIFTVFYNIPEDRISLLTENDGIDESTLREIIPKIIASGKQFSVLKEYRLVYYVDRDGDTCRIALTAASTLAANNIATLAVNVALFLFDMSYDLISLTWIKRIIYWLSLYRRYNTFYMGVFSVADLFYYISAAAVFIFLTVRVMEKKRWN